MSILKAAGFNFYSRNMVHSRVLHYFQHAILQKSYSVAVTSIAKYSGDLNSKLVRYLNGPKEFAG